MNPDQHAPSTVVNVAAGIPVEQRLVAVEVRQAEAERRLAKLEEAETNLARTMAEGFQRLSETDGKLATGLAVVQTRVAIYAGGGSIVGGAIVSAILTYLVGH